MEFWTSPSLDVSDFVIASVLWNECWVASFVTDANTIRMTDKGYKLSDTETIIHYLWN